ncbi:hypothetical protein [Bradyrhizobium lablabi]|uniref:hypothetical protein n=1 Tax=Bradyrhizobium lablabi TaxID=722472 RepID=UPI001BA9BEA0|nr:hypothetical protein [Bradyrhizobium lablabi]MBR0692175.1 hypothetical protein [Bradyrhizobium lablabi]
MLIQYLIAPIETESKPCGGALHDRYIGAELDDSKGKVTAFHVIRVPPIASIEHDPVARTESTFPDNALEAR